jgi:hypothetical protein
MKKLILSGVAATPSSARSKHPIVEPDPSTLVLLEQFAQINPQFKIFKNQSETLSKQIGASAKRMFFERFNGVTPESSTMLVTAGGTTIKLIVKNSYSKQCDDESGIVQAIGQDKTSRYFRQATVLKLELDKVPEDKQEAFANRVLALASEMGVSDAVSASQCIQPVAGFHEARTTILTAAENLALDGVLAITAYPQI